MRGMDFTSWQGILSTILGLALITLIGVGVRLLAMTTIQQRRERENRQINERLKTLIAAYKVLGGSFTGNLTVDPTHLRQLRERDAVPSGENGDGDQTSEGSDRARRTRDAVEAALSDIILLGTDEQVRLAAMAARELAEGRQVHTADLVVSLRDFVRKALTLDPVPAGLEIPRQGPTRPAPSSGRGGRGQADSSRGGRGGGGGGMGGAAGGAGMGIGMGLAVDGGSGESGDKTG